MTSKPLIDEEGRISPEAWDVYLQALKDQRDDLDRHIKRWEERKELYARFGE
jgi:hypothetical protein